MTSGSGGEGASRRRAALLGAVLVLFGILGVSPARAAADVEVIASIDGRAASSATEGRPVPLRPGRAATVDVQVVNHGDTPLEVRTVRLEGRVMGLTFFAYDTTVGMTVPAGAAENRRYTLDLVGIKGQATGLIQARIAALDGDRHELGSQSLVVDVRGSLWSVYGLFGLASLFLAVSGLGGFLLAVRRHRQSPNRWVRATRLVAPGVGIALVVVFLLSAARILVPRPSRWGPILLILVAVAFIVGYLSPSPDDEDEDEDEDVDDDLITDGPTRGRA